MSELEIGFMVWAATFFILMWITLWQFDKSLDAHRTKREAVKRGYANWVPDENGKTKFVWRDK